MLGRWRRVKSVFEKAAVVHRGSPCSLTRAGRVTVLVLLFARFPVACRVGAQTPNFTLIEFSCEFHLPVGMGYLDGLMASDVPRQRIAIYWIEPAMFRESASFLRCCDLIFDGDVVHYWTQGLSQPGMFHQSEGEADPLFPVQKSSESILRSALAIVSRIRCPRDGKDILLGLATFFERSRGQGRYRHEVVPGKTDPHPSSNDAMSGAQVVHALPYGREYSKETRGNGSVVWRVRKAANGPPVAIVTIKCLHEFAQDAARGTFDVGTLGQWTLIDAAHRAYWSFDRALAEAGMSPDPRVSGRGLYGKLNSYLDYNKVPPEVGRALDRVRFQAALMTTDSNSVWQSAQAVVTRLCADETVPKEQCIMDLGSMSARIREQCPEPMEGRLRPLVAQVVRHAGQEACARMNRLMVDIISNGWFTYGELLLPEMRRASLMEQRDVDSRMAKLQASRLARGGAAHDPCDAMPSVQRYLSQLDADPPKGALDMSDIHHILNEGLARQYTADRSESKRQVVEDTIRAIRLVAGEGPFHGDPDRLIASIDRFSRHCLVVNGSTEPLDTVLATFLALSFCDNSTQHDHEVLFSQVQRRSTELQAQVNAMLAARGLASFVAPPDVAATFQMYEHIFRRYVDDPLWPTFKFPWTHDEENRLAGKLRLRLMQLEPLLDEASLKVKYGGTSPELKDRTVGQISEAAQELLPQAAFLRVPPYAGVSCQYYGGYGFTVVIRGRLYQEGKRPKETFRAMKYFHLGHRLQSVVRREFISHAEKEGMQK
jgi:hypothetical protein